MWINYLVLVVFGISAGVATAGGYFAVIASIGLITRFAQHSHTASYIRVYETVLISGVIVGNALWIFNIPVKLYLGVVVLIGICIGIFVGCFLVSIAEALKGIPIILKRVELKRGIGIAMFLFALGKSIGACCYFLLKIV